MPKTNVTISIDDGVLARIRVKAAERGQSVSTFFSDLARAQIQANAAEQLAALEAFFDAPAIPGAANAWQGREELYQERDDELLRRYESARLRGDVGRSGETADRQGFAEGDNQSGYPSPEPSKPE